MSGENLPLPDNRPPRSRVYRSLRRTEKELIWSLKRNIAVAMERAENKALTENERARWMASIAYTASIIHKLTKDSAATGRPTAARDEPDDLSEIISKISLSGQLEEQTAT